MNDVKITNNKRSYCADINSWHIDLNSLISPQYYLIMRIRVAFPVVIILLALFLTGCHRSPYKADVSDIKLKMKINRLEKDLFTLNPNNIADSIGYLKNKYGNFIKYFSYVINIGEITDSSWTGGLTSFCTNKLNNEVYGSVITVFPEVANLEQSITDAFRHYKYYFPGKPVPTVYTFISGFNNSLITGDSVLAIGLDRYLGSESRYYKQLMLYEF